MESETGEGCVEGFVGGEELGEGEDSFATELLVDATLAEEDGEDVADCGEGCLCGGGGEEKESVRAAYHYGRTEDVDGGGEIGTDR